MLGEALVGTHFDLPPPTLRTGEKLTRLLWLLLPLIALGRTRGVVSRSMYMLA
jgi:hypothetical protein